MLAARVVQAFTIGKRHILSCEVPQGNPHSFLNKEMWFFSSQSNRKQVRVEGISTANDVELSLYDFHYSGTVILPEEITRDSVLTDAGYYEAVDSLCPPQK